MYVAVRRPRAASTQGTAVHPVGTVLLSCCGVSMWSLSLFSVISLFSAAAGFSCGPSHTSNYSHSSHSSVSLFLAALGICSRHPPSSHFSHSPPSHSSWLMWNPAVWSLSLSLLFSLLPHSPAAVEPPVVNRTPRTLLTLPIHVTLLWR